MRTAYRKIICSTLFFVLIIFTISYAENSIVERPTYTTGDFWIFTTADGEDVKIEFLKEVKDRYYFSKNGVQVIKDFNLTPKQSKKQGYPGPVIKFPLKVGKSWTYNYRTKERSEGSKFRIARHRVIAYEQITVPAGTFWTFKVEVKKENDKRNVKGSVTYWYAPDVKYIIKSSRNTGKTLKEYKVGNINNL